MKKLDLVLGIKNIFELEGIINSQDFCFQFLEKVPTVFSKRAHGVEAKRTEINKGRTPFIDEYQTSYY